MSTIGYFLYNFLKPKTQFNYQLNNSYNVSIEGAIKNPGNYSFKEPKTIREIIFVSNVLTSADLSSLDLERVIDHDYDIVVPFKVNSIVKIKWKDLHSIEQLTSLGVKNSIAKIIINHRRQNESTTWEEILALKGIGPITLAQLKDIIDLF